MNAMPKEATPEGKEEQPSFVFFRATPADMMKHPPLASSLQSFETCLFLIALERFPGALAACATAVESVIKAKLGMPPGDRVQLWELLKEIRRRCVSLRLYDESKLARFRETRNRVVHYGFSPRDDERCAVELLETGLPFLEKCYSELFRFDLISRPGGGRQTGLDFGVAKHYEVCREVYQRARQLRGIEFRYCFRTLAHYITLMVKQTKMTAIEYRLMQQQDERGVKDEHEARERYRIEGIFQGGAWEFDCPVCGGRSTMMAELDGEELNNKRVLLRQCICVRCEMVVPEGCPYLCEQLFSVPTELQAKIMKESGIR